jgi:hypothetical protein
MAEVSVETVMIRYLQGLAVLLSCFPKGGKVHEFFQLALDAEGPAVLARAKVDAAIDDDAELKAWLEKLWAPDGLHASEQGLVEWQNNSDNMTAALDELRAVVGNFGSL